MNGGWVHDARVGDRLLLHDIRAVVEGVDPDGSWVELAMFWEHDWWFERRMLPLGPHAYRVHRPLHYQPGWNDFSVAALNWASSRD